jgi:hypothetical protein
MSLMIDRGVVAKQGFETVLGTHLVKDQDGTETTLSFLIGQRPLCQGHTGRKAIVCKHIIEAGRKGERCDMHCVPLDDEKLRVLEGFWLCTICLAKYEADELEIDACGPVCGDCMRKNLALLREDGRP